jgi:riboflavin synthase
MQTHFTCANHVRKFLRDIHQKRAGIRTITTLPDCKLRIVIDCGCEHLVSFGKPELMRFFRDKLIGGNGDVEAIRKTTRTA